ncbi:MAG: PAS domain-containing protein [Pseudomonadota bacterium]
MTIAVDGDRDEGISVGELGSTAEAPQEDDPSPAPSPRRRKSDMADLPVEEFSERDLLMSRTDHTGIILTANQRFADVSGYSLGELIGKPHKIVRHSDMPRGVFHLQWAHLNDKKPFVGFVKNRAADRRHYWVLAVVLPLEIGHLSVRLKPRTKHLESAKKIYSKLLEAEKRERIDPAASSEALVKAVQEAGFQDYTHFACEALVEEAEGLRNVLQTEQTEDFATYEAISEQILELNGEVKSVVESFDRIQGSPANLSIQGSRLDEGAAAVKVIAQNYGLLSEQLRTSINAVWASLHELNQTAQQGRMFAAAVSLYRYAIDQFEMEDWPPSAPPRDAEIAILKKCRADMDLPVQQCFRLIEAETRAFVDSIAKLRMQASGLAVTRVMCNIEAATVRGDTSGLSEITRRLSDFQRNLSLSLDNVQRVNAGLSQGLASLTRRNRSPVTRAEAP